MIRVQKSEHRLRTGECAGLPFFNPVSNRVEVMSMSLYLRNNDALWEKIRNNDTKEDKQLTDETNGLISPANVVEWITAIAMDQAESESPSEYFRIMCDLLGVSI